MTLFSSVPFFADAVQVATDESLPSAPVKLFSIFGFDFNNSLIEETIAAIVVIVFRPNCHADSEASAEWHAKFL